MAICLAGMVTASAAVASPQRTQIVSASFDHAAARHGTQVTLTVETLNARCVTLAGAHTGTQTATTRDATTWTFVLTAGTGDHLAQVAVNAFVSPECTGPSDSASAHYLLDNTAPVIRISRSRDPIPVEFWEWVEWYDGDVVVEDNVGNVAWWSSEIGLDETPPTATAETRYVAETWSWYWPDDEWGEYAFVGWSCHDDTHWAHGSGVVDCPRDWIEVTREGFQVPVTATIHDAVGHETTATTYVNIDRTAPTLTGEIGYDRPSTGLDGTEWGSAAYVRWTCDDPNGSGVVDCPEYWWDSEVTTEGFHIPVTNTIHDRLGHETTTTVYANIDYTPPSTTVTQLPESPDVLQFTSTDNVSGAVWMSYGVDSPWMSGQPLDDSGTGYILLAPGNHTVEYEIYDNAFNVEYGTIQVFVPEYADWCCSGLL